MPVHVESMESEVGAFDGDMPLSEAQVERLLGLLMQRLERRQRESRESREATALRSRAAAPPPDERGSRWD